MIKCDKCGSEKFLLLTRQNPKGEKGIFHCEKCTGTPVNNIAQALVAASDWAICSECHVRFWRQSV